MMGLFERPILIHRELLRIPGVGLEEATMLSFAIEASDGGKREFCMTMSEWEEMIGLSRREQERARKILADAGMLMICRRGVPARLCFSVNMDAVMSAVNANSETE